jgi:hypothetical protein
LPPNCDTALLSAAIHSERSEGRTPRLTGAVVTRIKPMKPDLFKRRSYRSSTPDSTASGADELLGAIDIILCSFS